MLLSIDAANLALYGGSCCSFSLDFIIRTNYWDYSNLESGSEGRRVGIEDLTSRRLQKFSISALGLKIERLLVLIIENFLRLISNVQAKRSYKDYYH